MNVCCILIVGKQTVISMIPKQLFVSQALPVDTVLVAGIKCRDDRDFFSVAELVIAHAHIMASLNGREPQLMIDPDVDLASVPTAWLGHADWILPLETPLRAGNAELSRGANER